MADPDSQPGACTQPAAPADDHQQAVVGAKAAWGRLVSCHPDSKHVDLQDDEIMFGRNHKKCVVVLQDPTVSGVHCRMARDAMVTSSGKTPTVWITDFSTNGTYIKGILLGKDKTTVLQNGDLVSFTSSKMNSTLSFIYQDLLVTDQDGDDLEIKKFYIIQGTLGTGNFSIVKQCIKKTTGEMFAVKIIDKKKYWHMSSTRNQTESEINILKQIKHPNIISIIEIFDTERYLYIVLELATGGELFDKIKQKGKFCEPEAKDVFKQILTAVSYLHQLNISHRDLKPENILYGVNHLGEPVIKITDFGLAKIIGEKEIATTLCGTPLYVDKNNSFQQIKNGQFSFELPVWKPVSDPAKDLITKLLNVDPTLRIPVKDALNHPWFHMDELYRHSTSINESPLKIKPASPEKAVNKQPIIHLSHLKSQNSAISLNLAGVKKGLVGYSIPIQLIKRMVTLSWQVALDYHKGSKTTELSKDFVKHVGRAHCPLRNIREFSFFPQSPIPPVIISSGVLSNISVLILWSECPIEQLSVMPHLKKLVLFEVSSIVRNQNCFLLEYIERQTTLTSLAIKYIEWYNRPSTTDFYTRLESIIATKPLIRKLNTQCLVKVPSTITSLSVSGDQGILTLNPSTFR
eukprot:gene7863-9228_t